MTFIRSAIVVLVVLSVAGVCHGQVDAANVSPVPGEDMPSLGKIADVVEKATKGDDGRDWSAPVKLAVVFAGLAALPSVLVMMTSFTRIVIVLSFVRKAMTTQAIPPNMAIIGLALFLTLFTMAPTMTRINVKALTPYTEEKIDFRTACTEASTVMKEFMIGQARQEDLGLFLKTANLNPESVQDIPLHVVIPAFAISEFRRAFEMGCLLFIPFLLIDMVVAGILLSAGMMMLPPTIISMPFKIILFVLVDGWSLLTQTLLNSFVVT